MIEFVFRPSRGGVRSRNWHGRYRTAKGQPMRTLSLETPEKAVARARLRAIVSEAQREEAGLLAPRAERVAAAAPLADLLTEYLADLRSRTKAEHVGIVRQRITDIVAGTGWRRLADIDGATFIAWRARQHIAATTLNGYYAALHGFINWLVELGRLAATPLRGVRRINTRGLKYRDARAFTEDELRQLFSRCPVHRSVYMTLLYTGQRRKEVRALAWGDVHLDGERPHIHFRDTTTKDGKKRAVPLHPALAAALRPLRPDGAKADAPVFDRFPNWRAMCRDLRSAGIMKKDALGRVLHFHSFRKTFQTLGVLAGVNQRAAQEFLGHADANLTAKVYTDIPAEGYHAEIQKLPWIGAENDALKHAHGSGKVPFSTRIKNIASDIVEMALFFECQRTCLKMTMTTTHAACIKLPSSKL
jgi:integrase